MRRVAPTVLVAALLAACGTTSSPVPTTVERSPSTLAVSVEDPARSAHLSEAIGAIEAYTKAIGAVTKHNLRGTAPRLAAAHMAFATALAAVEADQSLARARLVAWRGLDRAMSAVDEAAARGDAKAFLAADRELIAASAAAG